MDRDKQDLVWRGANPLYIFFSFAISSIQMMVVKILTSVPYIFWARGPRALRVVEA